MARWIWIWISLFLAALIFPSSSFAKQPGAIKPGDGFQVSLYDVELTPDLQTKSVSGQQSITFEATSANLSQLAFSPIDLIISTAQIDGTPISVTSEKKGVVFLLPRPLAMGDTATITFQFAGVPKRGVTIVPSGVFTGYFACDWMVCLQNSPGDKADFHLDLTIPRGLSSHGVGQKIAAINISDTMALHSWRSDMPTSPYLFAFAAGDFSEQIVQTPHGQLSYVNATGEEADLPALFADTPDMLAFFAERAGMDLPGGHYTQLLVPGRTAQETMSFSLIGAKELALERANPTSAWIIAHELAHQWWGNSVTSNTWKDFWLNEGFATFIAAAWEQHHFGEAAYQQELDILRSRRQRLRELGYDKPLTWTGAYPSIGYRRAVQYSKGALFLAHLRETIGEDAFWKGVKDYTTTNAGKSVTSRDLQIAMEQASGEDLEPLFVEWVYGAEIDNESDTETSGTKAVS